MIILFSPPGLLPVAIAIIAVLSDTVLNRRTGLLLFKRIDWSFIVLFFSLFIWMRGFTSTRLPRYIFQEIGLAGSTLHSPIQIVIVYFFVLVLSSLIGSVPVTLIVLDLLEPCTNQLALVLYLAWTSSIAGNFMLFGSVVNLIVAQKAGQILRFKLTFWNHLQYGFLTAIVISIIGILLLYGLLQI